VADGSGLPCHRRPRTLSGLRLQEMTTLALRTKPTVLLQLLNVDEGGQAAGSGDRRGQ
jgi:hypothetical protein